MENDNITNEDLAKMIKEGFDEATKDRAEIKQDVQVLKQKSQLLEQGQE